MIVWADSFKLYGGVESYMDDGLYAQTERLALTEDPDPQVSGTVVLFEELVSNGNQELRKVLPTEEATVGVALNIWMTGLPNDPDMDPRPIEIRNNQNERLCRLSVTTTGSLVVTNSSGTTIASSGPALVSNAWQHLEMKVFLDSVAGTVEVRVDGLPVISETNVDTLGTATPTLAAQIVQTGGKSGGGAKEYYIKNYVIWDTNGTQNIDFLGSVSVYDLLPNSDVAFNWTPSVGTEGFSLIDNVPPVDGTDYITAGLPLPAASDFGLTNLPNDVTSVRTVMVMHRTRKIDGGDGNIQTSMVSNGMADTGTDRPVTTAFTYWYDFFPTDPNTGQPWLPGDLDAAQVRINRTV